MSVSKPCVVWAIIWSVMKNAEAAEDKIHCGHNEHSNRSVCRDIRTCTALYNAEYGTRERTDDENYVVPSAFGWGVYA